MYSALRFLSSVTELFIRLPLETVLRRAHIATYKGSQTSSSFNSLKGKKSLAVETLIPVAETYRGIVPTMWDIVRYEGAPQQGGRERAGKRGQGIEGLFRGWRVGLWGLVGVWTVGALGARGSGSDVEF
jgi:mitochondrial fusion and transport protein UGO1